MGVSGSILLFLGFVKEASCKTGNIFSPGENLQCLKGLNLQTGHYTLPETQKVGHHEEIDNADEAFF